MSSVTPKDRRPAYWRSLAELEDKPEFRDFVEREFREPLEQQPPGSPARRRFMQLMSASFGLAGVAGCRWQEDKLMPHSRRPEGQVPGEPQHYATMMELGGAATGLWVKSYDGRPIKVEGNPQDATSLGGTHPYHQGSVLGLYDADRSQGVVTFSGGRKGSSFEAFSAFLDGLVKDKAKSSGKGLAVLTEGSSSPSQARLRAELRGRFHQLTFATYDPSVSTHEAAGADLAFGRPYRALFSPARANIIVSLDSDFINGAAPFGLAYARQVASRRDPDRGSMSRIYAVEGHFSEIGALADHRVPLRSGLIKALAAYLDAEISAKASPLPELGPAQPALKAAFLEDAKIHKLLTALIKDLLDNVGKSLIVAGAHQPAEVHALVHRINRVLGNVGNTVRYVVDPDSTTAPPTDELKALTEAISGGRIDSLIILGGNPAFTSPADIPFGEVLGKLKHSVHLSLHEDETSQLCHWHVPEAHFLESWSDARAYDGSVRVGQPLIAPIFGGLTKLELLAWLMGDTKSKNQELVRRGLKRYAATGNAWKRAVHDGRIDGTGFPSAKPDLRPLAPVKLSDEERAGVASGASLELSFEFDGKVLDGRFANNGWLQELPHSISKLTWDNAALLSPSTAEKLGVEDGHLVRLSLGERSVQLPALHTPGMAEGSVRVALGYGRTHAGHIGGLASDAVAPVGADAYQLRTTEAYFFASGASLSQVGGRQRLAITQDLHAIDDVGKSGTERRLGQLVREGTLEEYREHPEFIKQMVHHPPLLDLWQSPISYDGQKWGMATDMNKCTGCSACVMACQAENNTPVVGKERVAMGREMHWIRIDRYYKGDPADPEIKHQPLTCQQCEKAPCEQVCPVGATMHSTEGLNDMVYNRCIGTRYCSNNCPYKVRRFNYFNYNVDTIGMTPFTGTDDKGAKLKSMVFNPDVTVRSRGVMEKCTFCVQRIQAVKIQAKNAARPIKDGEIKVACEQACPTGAIVFGDLNDARSRVARDHKRPRAYEMLQELNNKTRNNFLGRISNPNPELISRDGHGDGH